MIFETLEKHLSLYLIISFCSIILFVFFLTLSMFFYPDGLSPTGYNGFDGYSFWKNYISDLGMTHTFGGVPNPVSSLFLLIGIITLSIGGSLFYLLAFIAFSNDNENDNEKDNDNRSTTRLSATGSIFGIVACIFLLGISIFPKDTKLELHEIASILFFLFTFAAVLIYNQIILKHADISNKYTILGYIFILCVVIYAIVPKLIFPQLNDETQFIFKPASQKIAVISLLMTILNYILMIKEIKLNKNETS